MGEDDGLMAALEAIQGIIEHAKAQRGLTKPDEPATPASGPALMLEIESTPEDEDDEE